MTVDPSHMAEFTEAIMKANTYHQGLQADHLVLPVMGYSEFLKYPGLRIQEAQPPFPLINATERLTIDEFLGSYDPSHQQITLFESNIEKAAEVLECRQLDLHYVIRFHEYAHAALHLGVSDAEQLKAIQDKRFTKARLQALTRIYMNIDPCLHEHVAQLVTYHALKRLSDSFEHEIVVNAAHRMLVSFNKLMHRQPAQYRVDRYLSTPLERLTLTIRLLKEESLVGKFTAWREIMELK